MRQSDQKVRATFNDALVPVSIKRIPFLDDSIRYIQSGLPIASAEFVILGIHGAPGASDSFFSYLLDSTLREKANLISVDRPGYGFSLYGTPMISIESQADAISKVLEFEQAKNIIILSHSYGCVVGAVLTSKYPDRVKSHIMLSPVIDPDHEKIFWYSHIPSTAIGSIIFSKANQVASVEKMTHVGELRKIESFYSATQAMTVLFHGAKDWIAPVINAEYPKGKIADSLLRVEILPDASHFIPWTREDLILKEIHHQMSIN